MPAKLTFSSLFLLCLATIAPTLAHADTWKEIGETGGPIFWAAGLGSSLLQDGKLGVDHAARTTDGFIAALALTEGLKATVRERRPYQDKVDSFPAGTPLSALRSQPHKVIITPTRRPTGTEPRLLSRILECGLTITFGKTWWQARESVSLRATRPFIALRAGS